MCDFRYSQIEKLTNFPLKKKKKKLHKLRNVYVALMSMVNFIKLNTCNKY